MANDITKAVNYLADPNNLNGVFTADAQLEFLLKRDFIPVGANSIRLPINTYGVTEIPDYDRVGGYEKVDINRKWDNYTLTQDWGMQLEMDEMDAEESKSDAIISFANDATRRLTVPRSDKYIGGVLVAKAGKTVEGDVDATNIVDAFDEAVEYFEDEGVVGKKHLLITPQANRALKNANAFTRQIDVEDDRTGITRKVSFIDDVEVHVILGKRLPEGVNFILLSEDAVFGAVKHNPSYFFAAGTYPGKDANVVDIRLYFDFWVYENKQNGVYVHKQTTP